MDYKSVATTPSTRGREIVVHVMFTWKTYIVSKGRKHTVIRNPLLDIKISFIILDEYFIMFPQNNNVSIIRGDA